MGRVYYMLAQWAPLEELSFREAYFCNSKQCLLLLGFDVTFTSKLFTLLIFKKVKLKLTDFAMPVKVQRCLLQLGFVGCA